MYNYTSLLKILAPLQKQYHVYKEYAYVCVHTLFSYHHVPGIKL